MERPTTYEGWLALVKEADTIHFGRVVDFLKPIVGVGPFAQTIIDRAYSETPGHSITEHQRAYAKTLHEHYSPKPKSITADEWLKWMEIRQMNFDDIFAYVHKKTGYDLSEFNNLAKVLGSLNLTLKEGQSL